MRLPTPPGGTADLRAALGLVAADQHAADSGELNVIELLRRRGRPPQRRPRITAFIRLNQCQQRRDQPGIQLLSTPVAPPSRLARPSGNGSWPSASSKTPLRTQIPAVMSADLLAEPSAGDRD